MTTRDTGQGERSHQIPLKSPTEEWNLQISGHVGACGTRRRCRRCMRLRSQGQIRRGRSLRPCRLRCTSVKSRDGQPENLNWGKGVQGIKIEEGRACVGKIGVRLCRSVSRARGLFRALHIPVHLRSQPGHLDKVWAQRLQHCGRLPSCWA